MRDRVRSKLVEVFASGAKVTWLKSAPDTAQMAHDCEEALHKHYGGTTSAYKARSRTLLAALPESKNALILSEVMRGSIGVRELAAIDLKEKLELLRTGSKGTGKAFGKAFLEANQGSEGVVSLPSGLQYKVLSQGSGEAHPTPSSLCEVHYEGRVAGLHPDGSPFDSSYARGTPTSFKPTEVIAGWTEALLKMVEGDRWEIYIPSSLAYGDAGRASAKIAGGDTLVFTLELLKVHGETVAKAV